MAKISSIDIVKMNIDKSYVVKIAYGSIPQVKSILIRVNTEDGMYGWGECSPHPMVVGSTQGSAFEVAKYLARNLIGREATAIEDNMRLLKRLMIAHSGVRNAFDNAMWDILGKTANQPVYKLLEGKNRELHTDITIGHEDSIGSIQKLACGHLDNGFTEIKMKTGRLGTTDFEHVKAVREIAGDKIQLKIDCNQGWDLATSLKNARMMEPLKLEYYEQPLPVWNLEDMARFRSKINTPVCADESVFDEKDAFKICKIGAADYLNIKLMKSGGIHTGLKINAVAESYGAKCMIGCMGETRLGLTASAHLVLARPNIQFLDLDSAFFNAEDPISGGIIYGETDKSQIQVPETPGLGLDVKEEFLERWEQCQIN